MNKHPPLIAMPVLGEQATGFYQAQLHGLYGARHDHAPCPLLLVETDFERLNAGLPDNYHLLTPLLGSLLEKLEISGATLYLLPNITLHAALDRLALDNQDKARIVNPIHCGIHALLDRGIGNITLAGTRHTMRSKQLSGYFEAKGITVTFPDADTITALDALRQAVFSNGYSRGLKSDMEKLLSPYENVVLACTELSMLNNDEDFIDLARLQIMDAIERL